MSDDSGDMLVEVTLMVRVPQMEDQSPIQWAVEQACYGFTQADVSVVAVSAKMVSG